LCLSRLLARRARCVRKTTNSGGPPMSAKTNKSAVVEYALHLAEQGFRIFPCKPNSKEPACYWQEDATIDPNIIWQWFMDHPDINYGVVLGSDCFALDLDCKGSDSGLDQFTLLELMYCEVPQTFTVTTPSGGQHRYFRGSAPNSVGKEELGN